MQKLWDNIREKTNGKNVVILGFGREGKSSLKALEKYSRCKSITIADLNAVESKYPVISGENYQKELDRFDVIIKSPGIVLENESILPKVTSQAELFLEAVRDNVIGITGTKGKSTTSTLLYHILKSRYNAVMMGNIGIPAFDAAERSGDGEIFVFEMSSHQLEYTKVSPKRAVYINLYPEHLDHYGTFEKYRHAKENIYRYQKAGDILWCDKSLVPNECLADIISVSTSDMSADVYINGRGISSHMGNIFIKKDDTILVGNHNVHNIGIVYDICRRYGFSDEEFLRELKTYKPLPHRLEYIGEKDGIKYYDDSISTICETAIQALTSLENVGSILIGGMDRGIDYTPLCEFLKKNPPDNIILMYDTGKRIYDMLKGSIKEHLILTENLEEAVSAAKEHTEKGRICLLSPAAASYGFFKNFEERGEKFREFAGL